MSSVAELDLSAMPQEASFAIPKQPDKEQALVAFYSASQAMVVWCNDGHIRFEIDEAVGPVEVANYLLDNDAPDHGLWVWEGHVRMGMDYHNDEPTGPEYVTECWRQPTASEWKAIMEQRNPFEAPDAEEPWTFGEKTSF